MRHGSLFSGIGGFDLAAQWMGWENVFQVEWDKWCQKVLVKNFPDSLRFGDIVEFNKQLQNGKINWYTESAGKTDVRKVFRERQGYQQSADTIGVDTITEGRTGCVSLGRIDIITGGFPCQPFSHAGKRKGTDDSRYLWPEMLTTIRILKPSFVIGENVAGLVSMENGKTLDRILADLENEGYTTEQFIIPACAVGAWHRRDRIWIIGVNTNHNTIRCNNGECATKEGSKRGCESFDRYEGLDKDVSDSNGQGSQRYGGLSECGGQWTSWTGSESLKGIWESEPPVGRVASRVPGRVDRLKGLGNAIVPQVAYELFKAIELLITSA